METARTEEESRSAEPTVLIVDDDAAIRTLLRTILEGMSVPCRVHEAENSEMALQIARATHIDLVLLDIVLPGSGASGVLVCQELCKDSRTRVVIVTGSTSEPILDACLSAGAVECVRKPFALDEVRNRAKEWLS